MNDNDGRRHTDELIVEMHTILTQVIQPDIKKLNRTVYGNGIPGLKTQVAVLTGAVTLLGSFVLYYLKCAIPSHLR